MSAQHLPSVAAPFQRPGALRAADAVLDEVGPMYMHVAKSPHMKAMQDVLDITAVIDAVLARDFGGKGRGIHSRLDSVRHPVPRELDHRLRYLAAVRNKALNEPDWEIPERAAYLAECEAAAIHLMAVARKRKIQQRTPRQPRPPLSQWVLQWATLVVLGGLLLLLVNNGSVVDVARMLGG